MSTADKPRILLAIEYEKAGEAYLRSLPPEHFMEATGQATQREITLESLALVKARRADVHVFNELLVQYPKGRGGKIQPVVPDNMVVLWDGPVKASGSYAVPLRPKGPFWVLEYVSKSNQRKDYEDSFRKYERDLKVPYYLIFYPDTEDLTLYRHGGRKYRTVKPSDAGRFPIPELDLEVGVRDGWVRFWYRGELLPLPAKLLHRVERAEQRAHQAERQNEELQRQLEQERQARLALEQELQRLRPGRHGRSSGGSA